AEHVTARLRRDELSLTRGEGLVAGTGHRRLRVQSSRRHHGQNATVLPTFRAPMSQRRFHYRASARAALIAAPSPTRGEGSSTCAVARGYPATLPFTALAQ